MDFVVKMDGNWYGILLTSKIKVLVGYVGWVV